MAQRLLGGRYRLDKRVGEGGMGSVYRAWDLHTGQAVAVKVLRRKLSEREHSRRRFAREVRAARLLDHPAIVRVLDYGEEGRPFLVMEYLEGDSLRYFVRRHRPDAVRLLELMEELCEALQHAHERGVVHRDLKPDNLFITPTGRLKVLDLGLARIDQPELSRLTRSGTALGTCTYMAPEQALGREADARSDLYAIGVILYEFLCGVVPFSADDPASVLYMHVHEEPRPPRELNPHLHPELESLILKLMQKAPERRPPSAAVLGRQLRRLRAVLQGQELAEPSTDPGRRAPPPAGVPTHLDLTGESRDGGREVSLLSADIPNFLEIARDCNPLELTELQAALAQELQDSVRWQRGHLLERGGTRVVAAFRGRDHALRAVRAARRMRSRVEIVTRCYALPVRPSLSAGVFAGSLSRLTPGGSWEELAREELLHGAARLEKLSRDLPDSTLVCGDCIDERLQVTPYRSLFIRGRREPVDVYRVVGA